MNSLSDRTVVITGANGGIARSVAQTLSQKGCRIVGLVRRNIDQLQDFLNQLPEHESGHLALLADANNAEQLRIAAAQIKNCDVLITTAGFSKAIKFHDLQSLDDILFDNILTANLRSVFTCIREFEPYLKKSPHGGLIVSIGSNAGVAPGEGSNLAYASSKAGLDMLIKNLAITLGPEIRTVSVCPGALKTNWMERSEQFYKNQIEQTPLKRIGTSDDIAQVVEALITHLKFVTGSTIVVDGGKSL